MKKLLIGFTLVAFLSSGIIGAYKANAQSTTQKPKTEKVQTDKDVKKATDNSNVTPTTVPSTTTTTTTDDATKVTKDPKDPKDCPMKSTCEPKPGCCSKDKSGCTKKDPDKK